MAADNSLQKSQLLLDDKVVAYLGAMDYSEDEADVAGQPDDDEDDFS